MLQKFSSGYYLKTYWIRLTDDSSEAKINDKEYELLKNKAYEDVPIIMKLYNNHFKVDGNKNISSHTLEIDEKYVSENRYKRNPFRKNVFVLKPSMVRNMYI